MEWNIYSFLVGINLLIELKIEKTFATCSSFVIEAFTNKAPYP